MKAQGLNCKKGVFPLGRLQPPDRGEGAAALGHIRPAGARWLAGGGRGGEVGDGELTLLPGCGVGGAERAGDGEVGARDTGGEMRGGGALSAA